MRRRRWILWLVFLLICAAFYGLRRGAEWKREQIKTEWAKEQELDARFRSIDGYSPTEANAVLNPGKTLVPTKVWRHHRYDVDFPASRIDPRFDGWRVLLQFIPSGEVWHFNGMVRSMDRSDDEALLGNWVITPPLTLPRQVATTGWWIVEHARMAGIFTAAIAWVTGIALIILVRGVRRPIARFCLAAALFCMLAAALDLSFGTRSILRPWNPDRQRISTGDSREIRWKKEIAGHPAWFDGAAAMALIALVLALIPSHQITGKQCPTCRYDLTGNVSGICPECGMPTPQALRRQRLAELTPLADQLEHIDVPVDSAVPQE